jgi:hypothetical protein
MRCLKCASSRSLSCAKVTKKYPILQSELRQPTYDTFSPQDLGSSHFGLSYTACGLLDGSPRRAWVPELWSVVSGTCTCNRKARDRFQPRPSCGRVTCVSQLSIASTVASRWPRRSRCVRVASRRGSVRHVMARITERRNVDMDSQATCRATDWRRLSDPTCP